MAAPKLRAAAASWSAVHCSAAAVGLAALDGSGSLMDGRAGAF
jgi:hypothetical protein